MVRIHPKFLALALAALLLPPSTAAAQGARGRFLILALPEPAAFDTLMPQATGDGAAPLLAVVIGAERSNTLVLNPTLAGATALKLAVDALRKLDAEGRVHPGGRLALRAPSDFTETPAPWNRRFAATLDRLRKRPVIMIEKVGHGRGLVFAAPEDVGAGAQGHAGKPGASR